MNTRFERVKRKRRGEAKLAICFQKSARRFAKILASFSQSQTASVFGRGVNEGEQVIKSPISSAQTISARSLTHCHCRRFDAFEMRQIFIKAAAALSKCCWYVRPDISNRNCTY
jgi:hypothetical protein